MITTDRSAFRAALPQGGRLLGLDVGSKTIGTALCDAGWSFASPAILIRRTKFTADKAALVAMIALIENHQTEDGHIRVPEALQPFMDGQSLIS